MPENSGPEQLERLKLFLEQSIRLFEVESKRWNDLEAKAASMVGFIGVMTSILIFGFESIQTIHPIQLQLLAIIFAIGTLFCSVICVILGVLAITPSNFRSDPNPIVFRKEYYQKDYAETLDTLAANISASWDKNREINDQKAKNIELMSKLIILNMLFIVLFIITTIYSYLPKGA